MTEPASRAKAVVDLLVAHRELSTIEWIEFRKSVVAAAACIGIAAVAAVSAWLAVNASVLVALRERPFEALGAVVGGNVIVALVAALFARRYLGRRYFENTRREAGQDLRVVLESFT